MKTHYVIIAAAAIVGSLANTAQAAITVTTESVSQVVPYGDLDLTEQVDAQTLYRRIKSAARNVCRHKGPLPIELVGPHKECVRGATERAVEDVNAPNLTSYHASRSGSAARRAIATLVRADLDESKHIRQ
jgi:UrcA family protein